MGTSYATLLLGFLLLLAAAIPASSFSSHPVPLQWPHQLKTAHTKTLQIPFNILSRTSLSSLRMDAAPRRVGIIGGGPAGLTTALALQRLKTGVEEVKVFERSAGNRPGIGGGLQVCPEALVLYDLILFLRILCLATSRVMHFSQFCLLVAIRFLVFGKQAGRSAWSECVLWNAQFQDFPEFSGSAFCCSPSHVSKNLCTVFQFF